VDISDLAFTEDRAERLQGTEVNIPAGAKVFTYDDDWTNKTEKVPMNVSAGAVQVGRSNFATVVKAARAGENWEDMSFQRYDDSTRYGVQQLPGSTVGEIVRTSQDALKAAGITHVVLYRGMSGAEGADPFDRMSSKYSEGIGTHLGPVSSGVTSWTTSAELAAEYGQRIVKAVVPVEHILSFDLVGIKSRGDGAGFTDYGYINQRAKNPSETVEVQAIGKEVLVSADTAIVQTLAKGAVVSSGVIELACHSKECAPPPVGKGGSSPSGSGEWGGSGVAPTVPTEEDLAKVVRHWTRLSPWDVRETMEPVLARQGVDPKADTAELARRAQAAALLNAMATQSEKVGAVWRGVEHFAGYDDVRDAALNDFPYVGDTIDLAPRGFSDKREIAENFAGLGEQMEDAGISVIYRIKSGAKGLRLNEIFASGFADESEIVMGGKFTVVSKTANPRNRVIRITLEQVEEIGLPDDGISGEWR
jgi:hypothetical protein